MFSYFKDSVTFDDSLPIGATEVEEIVDLSLPMNSESDAEIDTETHIKTATFSNALHCLEIKNIPHAAGYGYRFNSRQVIYSQFGFAIHQNDHQARRRFVGWAQNEIAVVPDFHKRILFSDEAHFWLNGYVNKQNCRIWSEANPQVYVETPLHPEKLTVWCALWAGGILLQKRGRPQRYSQW
ncbi:hypothetical protein TNCV_2944451 [Trichonephila clavipes]|nr:hypothetical protein TNCV_2944451 [Trichonephila clavipes]